jgi:hypothetical protein
MTPAHRTDFRLRTELGGSRSKEKTPCERLEPRSWTSRRASLTTARRGTAPEPTACGGESWLRVSSRGHPAPCTAIRSQALLPPWAYRITTVVSAACERKLTVAPGPCWGNPSNNGAVGRGFERGRVQLRRVNHLCRPRPLKCVERPAEFRQSGHVVDQVAPQDARRGGDVVRLEVHPHVLEGPRTFVTEAEQASWSAMLAVLRPLDDGPSCPGPAASSGLMEIVRSRRLPRPSCLLPQGRSLWQVAGRPEESSS